jgi:UDP-glucose 4-epimerase
MSRTLITGGAGFIGSHLAEALLADGDQVAVLDDCSTGSEANLAVCAGRVAFHRGSILDRALVERLVAEADRVVHLAAVVGVRRIMERRVESIRINAAGAEHVLLACAAHRRPVFVASSSEVYGKRCDAPFREDDPIVLGASSVHRWSYACCKLLDEFLALALHREQDLPAVVGRFFNCTGPRQSPSYGMVLPRFCAAAKAGRPLEVHGDGSQTRCFLHVADAVRAVRLLLACPAAVGRVVNIGGTEEIPMAGLARRVIAAAGSASPLRLVPYAEAFPGGGFEDMPRRVPDLARLRQLTGWVPERSLDAIIRDALG